MQIQKYKWIVILCVSMLFPLFRWIRYPLAEVHCSWTRLRMNSEGKLDCGNGRPLHALERLSLGQWVSIEALREKDWQDLYGQKIGSALAQKLHSLSSCTLLEKWLQQQRYVQSLQLPKRVRCIAK